MIVCNYRFSHGRPQYEMYEGEKRELGVVLGPSYDRINDLPATAWMGHPHPVGQW